MGGLRPMRKKMRKARGKTRLVKKFALKPFRHNIVRETLNFVLLLAIFYFGISGILTLALRTDSYWMAVISDSMKHNGEGWRDYYEARGENTYLFPLQDGFERGDMIIVQGVGSIAEIAVGDVVVMDQGPGTIPLVHRVVEIWQENGEARIRTKGDYAVYPGELFEPEDVLGKAIFVIPEIGWVSLWFWGK
jgi:hypothetical protein